MEEQAEYKTLKPSPGPNDLVIGGSGTAYKWLSPDEVSIPRYKHLQRLQIEFAYDASFAELVESDNRLYAYLNKSEFVPAAHEVMKRREGIVNLNTRRLSGLEVCATLLLAPGEDPATMPSEEQQAAKCRDLEAGAYSASFFFNRAADIVSGFREAFTAYRLTFSPLP